ncbi:MAG: DUF4422 domain-containing protein [Bacillota bacterium]
MGDVIIYVVTHKPYRMANDALYIPLQVGAIHAEHFLPNTDDTGDHISERNAGYCELTGLYWAWKNCRAQVIGLVHYRRYLGRCGCAGNPWKRILARGDVEKLLQTADVILPKARNYFIETNYSHYANAHHEKDLLASRECIGELYPDYLLDFDSVMQKTKGHRLNMMIMEKAMLDQYCEWLFSLLFLLEDKIDIANYDSYNKRTFGFIGERLLDVWLTHHQIRFTEVPVVNMEAVHWFRKGFRFLKRKFTAPRS